MTAPGTEQPLSVSVVIPCRGHAKELDACLRSLLQQDYSGSFEIIVVDSAADDAVLAAGGRYEQVHILRDPGGLLPGEARNLGASRSRARWLAFIDADCVAQADWLRELLRPLQQQMHLAAGAVGQARHWHPISVIDNMMQFAGQSPHQPAERHKIVASCNIAISRRDFEQVGGFPATQEACGEDVLFCYAVNRQWKDAIFFTPAACVAHQGRATWRSLWHHQFRFGQARGRLMLELTQAQRALGRHTWAIPAVMLRRLGWLAQRTFRNHPLEAAQLALFSPVLMVGLAAWSLGFRAGCRAETFNPVAYGDGKT
ncbi:glycosyltransferase [Roseobacter ponti]|uniref:Glycosyltransferase n=1 Tax=Roseobacter ponti TaxID=1891787 RepID=A0A858SR03_9RHOB|nr:glycosyltransferase [Roseobacter ponti]QJF50282.1 glycosyltransferase [Roseobacter ponti]